MLGLMIVCDLEATCWTDGESQTIDEMETIQIGCALCDLNGDVIDEFSTFVRPVKNPILSPFCKKLTNITQADVESSPRFCDAMALLDQWAADRNVLWGSWGNFDSNLLLSEQERNGANFSFTRTPHVNLKKAWRRTTKIRRQNDLRSALAFHGLEFVGTQHSAIDDARNTARLLRYIFQEEIALQLPS